MKSKRPKIYFSFRSPYSWLAVSRLDAIGFSPGGPFEFIPFWEPDETWLARIRRRGDDFPYTTMSKEKHLYILQDIKRLAFKLGQRLTWPVDRDPDWAPPHLVFLALKRFDKQLAFCRAVLRTRWREGRDVWRWDSLVELLLELGLNANEVIDLAQGEEIGDEGLDAFSAIYRDGVFGVPFFIHRREKFWGLDRLDMFLESVAQGSGAGTPTASTDNGGATTELRSSDQGHAGGCG